MSFWKKFSVKVLSFLQIDICFTDLFLYSQEMPKFWMLPQLCISFLNFSSIFQKFLKEIYKHLFPNLSRYLLAIFQLFFQKMLTSKISTSRIIMFIMLMIYLIPWHKDRPGHGTERWTLKLQSNCTAPIHQHVEPG